jgi:hypothetical protein
MFCGEIRSVKNTKILVGKVYPCTIVTGEDKLGRKRRYKKPTGNPMQLVIYSNQISLSRNPVDELGHCNTAMILPFPIIPGSKNRFKIFPMTNYGHIFDDVEMLFPDIPQTTKSSDINLPVMNIGSYSVLVVKDITALASINPEVFKVSQDLLRLVKQYYPKNFAFLVCMLKTNAQYHPIGYVHELKPDGKLFVPTRHFHVQDQTSKYSMNQFSNYHEWQMGQDGEMDLETGPRNTSVDLDNHYYDTIMQEDKWMRHQIRRIESDSRARSTADMDWDHHIYFVNHASTMKHVVSAHPDKMANVYGYLSMNLMPTEITFGNIKSMSRLILTSNTIGNRDISI